MDLAFGLRLEVPKPNSFTSPLGLTWKVTLTLSALPPAPMICHLAVNVAGPVLVLTLKLAPNHTAPTMRNVEVPLLATTPTGVEVPVTLVLPLAASVMCSTDFTVPLVMV